MDIKNICSLGARHVDKPIDIIFPIPIQHLKNEEQAPNWQANILFFSFSPGATNRHRPGLFQSGAANQSGRHMRSIDSQMELEPHHLPLNDEQGLRDPVRVNP